MPDLHPKVELLRDALRRVLPFVRIDTYDDNTCTYACSSNPPCRLSIGCLANPTSSWVEIDRVRDYGFPHTSKCQGQIALKQAQALLNLCDEIGSSDANE